MSSPEFVEERAGGYYLRGSRVSLASIIYAFREGDSPETIRHNFATLSLAQVYGAIAFYLSHPRECEEYLAVLQRKWDQAEQQAVPLEAELKAKLESSSGIPSR